MKEIIDDEDIMVEEDIHLLLSRFFSATKSLADIGRAEMFSINENNEDTIVVLVKRVRYDNETGFSDIS